MITKNNLKQTLDYLDFKQSLIDTIYIKYFKEFDCELKVDFKAEKLIYPKELKVNDKTTSNFSHPENFVVFECICRLLSIGYHPKHLEIEPRWSLGHSQKSGKADIGIKDNSGKNLVIIECKTYGYEYQKALNLTKLDGGQIFSYAANSGCEYITLYASDENAHFEYFLISLKDNENLLKNSKNLKSYKNARAGLYGDPAKALFEVWCKTYNQESIKGLFEKDTRAYEIEKKKFSLEDLKAVSESDIKKIYHQFATILRQHNVSSHENAFDKLVNLFLCKIVDEIKNKDELQFYYKGKMFDDEFSFSDRLQKLYKEGMKEFIGEDITYIENSEIESYFKLFNSETIKEKVIEAVNRLKFFTSNDFAFIDVHNEKLFYQNFEVLLKIVLLFQDITLTKSEENQFLGDLFEGFLDQGIKQNEGQYFTPMPIVKFIISSLPNKKYSSMCDYACGAGHFLNEFAVKYKKANIVGIEKEYRLSKVSKVSSFMYGNQNIKLIYDDALKKDVVKDKFDLIISNPPYSVKGFLQTLSEEDLKEYELIDTVDIKSYHTNNSIECFFIEKTKHLLNSGGIGAIIVPISILDKTNSKLFVKTREVILKYFDIKAITKLPTNTFGKTGTTTIILYLQKRDKKEDLADNLKEIVSKIFKNQFNLLESFKYKELFDKFIEFMEYDKRAYIDFIKEQYNKKLFKNEIFKSYFDEFKKRLKIKDKKSGYKKLRAKFIELVKERENDRLYFFMLALINGNVTVVMPPNKSEEIKKFLGYEWSSAKGNEGIKYISDIKIASDELDEEDIRTLSNITTINNIQTPLYNPKDEKDSSKINYYIKQTLDNSDFEANEELKQYIKRYDLVDMLDLKEVEFNKVINLNIKKEVEIKSRWELVKLGDVVDVKIGGTPSRKNHSYFQGDKLWVSISEMNGNIIYDTKEKITDEAVKNSNVKLIPKETTLLSFKLSIGKVAIAGRNLYTNEAIAGLIPKKSNILNKYLFYLFKSNIINLSNLKESNVFGKSLNSKILKENLKIPLPPIEIQEKIVSECDKVDKITEELRMKNEELKKEIDAFFEKLYNNSDKKIKLSNSIFDVKIGKRVLNKEVSKNPKDGIPVYSANVFEPFGYIKKDLLKDFSLPSVIWGIDGDWMVNFIKENTPFYPTDHCGVLRVLNDGVIHYRYLAFALFKEGEKENFSRVKRASIEKIKKIEIKYPSNYDLQKQIITKIETLEKQIELNNQKLNSIKNKKEEILKKWL